MALRKSSSRLPDDGQWIIISKPYSYSNIDGYFPLVILTRDACLCYNATFCEVFFSKAVVNIDLDLDDIDLSRHIEFQRLPKRDANA